MSSAVVGSLPLCAFGFGRQSPASSVRPANSSVSAQYAKYRQVSEKLRHDLRNQLPVHIRQPHIAAVVEVGELGMIHAQQVQDGSVQVVDRDRLLLGLVSELVAGADRLAALDLR